MTQCQHCRAKAQLYLCQSCTTQLANMLHQLPWLLDELDARIQKLDHIGVGTIGRNRRPDEMNAIDFDAAEQARKIRKTLTHWVTTVAERHTGRRPPALGPVSNQQLARWLEANVDAIARIDLAKKGRHPLYDDIHKLVGTGTDDDKGQLINAINPAEKHFAGPCPTSRRHDDQGQPIECGTILYADTYDTITTCPTCNQRINVEDNRRRANKTRDLQTTNELLEVLTNIGEPITPDQLNRWITAKRLRVLGYLHNGDMVDTCIKHSQPLYSVARARKLRRRDQQLTRLRHTLAEQR